MTRQTVLFTPGDEPRMVEKALSGQADMVILDVEDSVAPEAKDEACRTIASVLLDADSDDVGPEVTVRVNPLSIRGRRDVSMIADAGERVAGVVLPMVRDAQDVDDLVDCLDTNGLDAEVLPIVETPAALFRIESIAMHPRVGGLEFGAEDLTTELGATTSSERDEILYARQKVSAAASLAGIDALDMAWPDFTDEEGLRRNAEQAVRFGYDGKSAIHPSQLSIIREVFTPDPALVEWASTVVAAAEEAERAGKVVFQLDGEMIDPPIVDRARDVLERAGVSD